MAKIIPPPAFYRAIHALAHPITILAILLLLFNDHWLRWNAPSWLTGKLGDFIWLIFAPFIAALFFSWLIPRSVKNHEFIVGILSFTGIGLWFALAKTVPFVHEATITIWRAVIGWDATLLMDSSDLLALPGLLVGWWIWGRADNQPFSLRPAGYIAFGLGILSTLATSPGTTDFGLWCVVESDGKLFAYAPGYNVFTTFFSLDGGFTWQSPKTDEPIRLEVETVIKCPYRPPRDEPFTLVDPTNRNIQYRFRTAQAIDRSTDGGKTWTQEFDLSFLGQDIRRVYHEQERRFLVVANPGPFDAVMHHASGNLVVAMGHDGILVRVPGGSWKWVQVGSYRLQDIQRIDLIFTFIYEELIQAGILMFLILASFLHPGNHWTVSLLLGIGWFLWIVGVLIPIPKWNDGSLFYLGYFTAYSNAAAGFIGFIMLIAPIFVIFEEKISWDRVKITCIFTFITALLFLFPYLLWTQGTIPAHASASWLALLLCACSLFACGQFIKRRVPQRETTSHELSSTSD